MRGKVSSTKRDGNDYMHVDDLSVDLNMKGARLMVRKDTNTNRILSKYQRNDKADRNQIGEPLEVRQLVTLSFQRIHWREKKSQRQEKISVEQ